MPIRSSVTISLVPEARGGPFVFWDDLYGSCRKAKALGFDAVEVFPPAPEAIDPVEFRKTLTGEGLTLSAMGTGAGWLKHRLTLTNPDSEIRKQAHNFIKSIIDLAGQFGAPAIIGSMQGRSGEGVDHAVALNYLIESLEELGQHASQYEVPLIYEPLNRYETNLANTVDAGVAILKKLTNQNVTLLADIFHMNIEERDIASAIKQGGAHIGHVHLVDSNRRPVGNGHVEMNPIATALADIQYQGFVSAEALPYPDSETAAAATINAYRRLFSNQS